MNELGTMQIELTPSPTHYYESQPPRYLPGGF